MLSFSWYLQYALRTLFREGRHARLALFCLSTGIALLVSMQTLGLVLKDSLAASGQMLIGADLVVTDLDDELDAWAEQPFAAWRANGDLVDYTTVATPQLVAKKGNQTSILESRVIDPAKYPLYGAVPFLDPPDGSLAALLRDPDAIVISEQLAQRLDLVVGDAIEVESSRARSFRITGIIPSRPSRLMTYDTASLLGVGYLSRQAAAQILAVSDRDKSDQFLVKTQGAAQSQALAPRIQALSTSYQVQRAETELTRNVEQVDGLNTLFLYVALMALLTSGVAIADTMLASITRRQDEIAILKTLGMDGFDLVVLFVLEAALRGLAGSLLGIALGTVLGLALQGFAEQFFGQLLAWRVHVAPILNALVVGPLAAIAFSLLPVLAASGIRPVRLIHRQIDRQPKRNYLASGAVVLATTGLLGLLAGGLIGDGRQGEILAFGALGALLVLVVLFMIVLFLAEQVLRVAGRLSLNLQLAVRGLARRRFRSAITLTTLSIGILAIGFVTLLAGYARSGFAAQMGQSLGYNLFVFLPGARADREELALLEAAPGLLELAAGNQAKSELVRVNQTAAKKLIDERLNDLHKEYSYGAWRQIQGREVSGLRDVKIVAGRSLDLSDTGQRVLLVPDGLAKVLGLAIGDELILTVADAPARFTVVGIYKRTNLSIGGRGFITSRETVTHLAPLASSIYRLRVREEELATTTQFLSLHLKGASVINTHDLLLAMTALLDRLVLLPVLIAGLMLLVGSVMIANSVSLVTLQRHEEIGILKALGATGSRVLILIWLENNLIGLLGAAIGVGLALAGVAALAPVMFGGATLTELDARGILIPVAAALLVTSLATALAVWPVVRIRPAAALRNE